MFFLLYAVKFFGVLITLRNYILCDFLYPLRHYIIFYIIITLCNFIITYRVGLGRVEQNDIMSTSQRTKKQH